MTDFDELDRRFLANAETAPFDRPPPIEWHQGRDRYGVWALELDSDALASGLDVLRTQFTDVLLPNARAIEHITLFAEGFLVAQPSQPDELSLAELDKTLHRIRQLNTRPVKLHFNRLASFTSAMIVPAEGELDRTLAFRRAIADGREEGRTLPYVPHCTVGVYQHAQATNELLAQLRGIKWTAQTVEATALSFLTYDPKLLQGPLRRVVSLDLENGTERWYV